MQSKLSSFFKPSFSSSQAAAAAPDPPSGDVTTYSRRKAPRSSNGDRKSESARGSGFDLVDASDSGEVCSKPHPRNPGGKVLGKKRSYAQLHLDLGQSDFNLRSCSSCGFHYAAGDDQDEKVHKSFHRNFTHGIPFRGWQNERAVPMACSGGDRIILILNSDASPHKTKVKDVIKMMEIELHDGWIFHELCKVYLYVSSNRIAGCLVAEPIKEAFKMISPSSTDKKADSGTIRKYSRSNSGGSLKFGDVIFKREAATKKITAVSSQEMIITGAVVCEEKSVPAACGIRAIWVTLSNRRKGIATQLLDAARESFCENCKLERSQLAFSPPTSAGRPLACAYVGNEPLLLYKADPIPKADD
ncbi:unnamed protein product [Linum tenue]|uniref:Protein CHROMOSOME TRANSMISSION FIDELITY 7 n=1 Tax=Linum tenue TaxID=586396 RepID=A0AAV0NVF9_9ROSI|nr:unnamed protein product [Linum tenue]